MEFADDDPAVIVERDAQGVIQVLARSVAESESNAVEASTLRLLGMAEAEVGSYALADQHLAEAHRRALERGENQLAAECRVSLANVVARQGRMPDSIEMLKQVIPLLTGLWLARARSNLVGVLLHAGRHEEALEESERGIDVAERAGETWPLATLLNNRGLIHLGAGNLRRAAADFESAEELLVAAGREQRASLVAQNLAVATARLGDLRRAMEMFEEARIRQQAAHIENASLLVDYAETMLLAGLIGDATPLARRALHLLEQSGNRMEIANVYLLLARCAFGEGDPGADAYCRQAVESYRSLGDQRGVAMAKRVRFFASVGAGAGARTVVDPELVSLPSVDLAEVAVMASASSDGFDESRDDSIDALLLDARELRASGPLPSRLIGWCAEGVWHWSRGHHADVVGAVRSGLELVTEHATVLGSAAALSSTLRRLEVLCEVGVATAVGAGDLSLAITIVDEVRTSAADMACQPPVSGEVAELVARHRIAAQDAEVANPESVESATALAAVDQLERDLRRSILASPSEQLQPTGQVDLAELSERLAGRALIATIRDRGRVVVLVLVDGEVTVHDGGDAGAVGRDTAALAAAFDRIAKVDFDAAAPAIIEALGESWRGPAGRLDESLLSSVRASIADRRVVIVPDPGLAGLAWAALPSLLGRPVEVAPSPSYWASVQPPPAPSRGKSTVMAVGPDVDLRRTEREAARGTHEHVQLLAGSDATVKRICAAVDGIDTLLLSGHGRYASAHALLSSVRVADGELCWYDLEAVSALPRTIVWNACQTGATSVGSNPFSTAAHALRRGCELLIAPVCTISDEVAAAMTTHLLDDLTAVDFAERLAVFQSGCHRDPRAWTALGYVAVGRSGIQDVISSIQGSRP